MKVFGKFKCVYCKGTGYDDGWTFHDTGKPRPCRACKNGYSHFRQELHVGERVYLEAMVCNRKGPYRKKNKWCVEVNVLVPAEDGMWHKEINGELWVWCHAYMHDAWSGSLKHAYKKALKNVPKALAEQSRADLHDMFMRLLGK